MIYVITKGSYSDYHICAVATHKETALAFCVTIVAPDFSGCDTVNLSSGLTQIVIVWAGSVT